MRTLLAVTLGWMSLTLAAPAGGVKRGYAPVNGLQLYYEIRGDPTKNGVPLAGVARMVDEFLLRGVNATPDSRR